LAGSLTVTTATKNAVIANSLIFQQIDKTREALYAHSRTEHG